MKRTMIVLALIALMVSAVVAVAKAEDRMSFNEAMVSDVITSDRACTKQNDQSACEHVATLVATITPQMDHDLQRFIWNEYPYKAKNGGTNIMLRYQRAIARQQR